MKRVISIVLALTLVLSIALSVPFTASAFSPDNFKAQIKKISIGKPITGTDGKKYLPVDVHFFAAEDLSNSEMVYCLEGYLKAKLTNGTLAEGIKGLGMTLPGPVKPDVDLDSNMWSWEWTPYETGGGQGVIKYNLPLLEKDETQTVEHNGGTNLDEVNGVKVGDQITIQNETAVNTSNMPAQVVQEMFPNGTNILSDPFTFTIEEEGNYPKVIEVKENKPETTVDPKLGKSKIHVGESTKVKPNVENGSGTTDFTTGNAKVAVVDKNGKVTGKGVGTTKITVTNNGVKKSVKITVIKKTNTIIANIKKIKVSHKKKTVISKAIKIQNPKGTIVFKKKSGNKKISINKNTGKITVKKGLTKGKTYKVKVKVTDKGNKTYGGATKTITFSIKVK
ncbi:MAG: Ig-like domain-containing protein [Ruminococcus sp.]|nr:Ig-like domain-containing protein [Ruminococcus sp.]